MTRNVLDRVTTVGLSAIGFLSFGNFNINLFDVDPASLQQSAILALWMLVGLSRGFAARRYAIATDTTAVYLAFVGVIAVALIFKVETDDSVFKLMAMIVSSAGALLCAATMDQWSILTHLRRGILVSGCASIVIALALPGVGLETDWSHAGQWRGLFQQKQLLGISSALLVLLSLFSKRISVRESAAGVAVGFGNVIGSFSKTSLGLLALAVLYRLVCTRPWVVRLMLLAPFVCTAMAYAALARIVATGGDSLVLMGQEITFTGRTYIWSFAIGDMVDFMFGDGLNVFWNDESNIATFYNWYGWALPNYHSGYTGLFVETGLTGVMFFVLMTALTCRKFVLALKQDNFHSMSCAIIFSYLYVLNFTETFFLRSTSGYNTVWIILCAAPFVRGTASDTTDGAGALRTPDAGPAPERRAQ